MCTTDVYTDVYPDGRSNKYHRPTFCHRARNGQVCDNPVVYQHPPRSLRWDQPTSQYLYPSRPMTPRHSSTASSSHRSGDESDRSKRSDKKRSSGIYINGTKVLDLNRKRRDRAERIVIVDSPPTARTPPQPFAVPYTAPPSPSVGYHAGAAAAASGRPVIVDERPQRPIEVEIVNDHASSSRKHRHHHHHHHRHSSHSSHSRSSSNNSASAAAAAAAMAISDEERRRQRSSLRASARAAAEAQQQLAERELRRQNIAARIRAANAEIDRRPVIPVPSVPTPPPPVMTASANVTSSAAKASRRATAVERAVAKANIGIHRTVSEQEALVDAVRRLGLSETTEPRRTRRTETSEERRQREEAEAQTRRLRERMMPRRRFTVGPGARRHRVMYEDGMYRWE